MVYQARAVGALEAVLRTALRARAGFVLPREIPIFLANPERIDHREHRVQRVDRQSA